MMRALRGLAWRPARAPRAAILCSGSARLVACPFSTGTGIPAPQLGSFPKTADGARQLYDSWAADYDAALRSWSYPAPMRTATLLKEYLPDNLRDGAVLDSGCGTGLSGEALLELGFKRLVGTDISPESFKVTGPKQIYERLEVANLEEPQPFDDNSFDAVVCVGVLTYVNQFDGLFADWCRVIRPGGIVVFTHRCPMWDDDFNSVRSEAEAQPGWKQRFVSPPEDYMPNNRAGTEREKRIQYVVYEVM